jgi:hypothetical protein
MFRDRERAELRSPESERAVYELGKSCQEKNTARAQNIW